MRVNNKKSLINPNQNLFLLFKAVVVALFFLSGTALAVDTQCKPEDVMVSGFENEMPLLFEDTFEGCHSPLWRELNGNWQVTDGAYHSSEFSNSNWLPLEPNNFTVELEMSDIQGGGLWMRLADGSGVILQIGSTSSDDFLYWQVLEADVLGPSLNPSTNGVITPDTGKHIIKVVVEGATYEAYVDGKLATTLTHADIINTGATPPTRGVVGLQGHGTSTRFDRIRIWGKNVSTMQIEFTSDQSVVLESVGQSYQFAAYVINSLGEEVPGIELVWSIEPNTLVSLTASDAGSATVRVDQMVLENITLRASAPSLQLTNDAQVLLALLAVDASYVDSNVVSDNGYASGQVVLVRNAETELIQIGDVLVSGDRAGLLVRVLSVTLSADQVILTTESAKITDAFANLWIDGSSAVQNLSVHFDAVTNLVDVRSSINSGVATKQSFSIDGLECKAEDQSNFGLNLTGGSIDWEINNKLYGSLQIIGGTVQEFSFSAKQSLVLTATTGALKFSSVLAGTVTCDLPLPKIETPTIPISVFSFGLGIQPKIGVKVSGSISGPSFSIEGPKGKLTDSVTEGIKYTAAYGWEPIGGVNRKVRTDPFSAKFDGNVEFGLDASAYGGIGFEIITNLGKGILSWELAAVEFAEFTSEVTLHSAFKSPFDDTFKDYTGPNWDIKGHAKGVFKAELTSGALVTLLNRLDVPTTLPFTNNIFDPIVVDIVQSPRFKSSSIACIPSDCLIDPAKGGHANIKLSTDGDESGTVKFMGSLDGAGKLVELTTDELFHSSSLGVWTPTLSTQEGSYKTYVRVETDALSKGFPYTYDTSGLQEVIVGPTYSIDVQKLDEATGTVTTKGKVTSTPVGIDCGETCNHSFAVNASVKLTAGYGGVFNFVEWGVGGECAGSTVPVCEVNMDSDKTAKALFAETPKTYFTDPRDNKVYETIVIDGKEWFREDLRYMPNSSRNNYHFSQIAEVTPVGWRTPTVDDFLSLMSYLGMTVTGPEGNIWEPGSALMENLNVKIGPAEDYSGGPWWSRSTSVVGHLMTSTGSGNPTYPFMFLRFEETSVVVYGGGMSDRVSMTIRPVRSAQ